MEKNLGKALADFQFECPVIHKGTLGYGYSFADLPDIFDIIKPLLRKHGIGFSQPPQGKSLETIIYHVETGEEIRGLAEIPSDVELGKMNDFQVAGSAYTYFRRYSLASMLGIITDVDNDAAGEKVTKASQKAKSEPKSVYETIVAQVDLLTPTEAAKALTKLKTDPNPALTPEEVRNLISKLEIKLLVKPF